MQHSVIKTGPLVLTKQKLNHHNVLIAAYSSLYNKLQDYPDLHLSIGDSLAVGLTTARPGPSTVLYLRGMWIGTGHAFQD